MVTRYPLACSSFARDAAMIPFPKEEETPPVTKMYFVVLMNGLNLVCIRDVKLGILTHIYIVFLKKGRETFKSKAQAIKKQILQNC